MVYLHFPSNLTEEELMLQNKYQKLKKKKKAFQLLKTPKSEVEKSPPVKRPVEAKDAKEMAKKLLKSGAISAIKIESKEKQGFKRSKNQERKLISTDKTQVSGYCPFQSAHPGTEEVKDSSQTPKQFNENNESRELQQKPKQGNTIYVQGRGVTDEMLRTSFAEFGTILNISMELDKNCGFITFEKIESADKAITKMNSISVSGTQLKVSLARRQPTIETINDPQVSNWTSIATSKSQKGDHKDKRDLMIYEENPFL